MPITDGRWLMGRVLRAALLTALLGVPTLAAQHLPRPGARIDRYDHLFEKYSKRFFGVGFDWMVFKAQAMTESNLDPRARSQVGARGVMQLMPSTYRQVRTRNPELRSIDDPEWNIAAGISYDRTLWQLWNEHPTEEDRQRFMFASYNAGRLTLLRAQAVARARRLDHREWKNIELVAPEVRRWRYRETLEYVHRIGANVAELRGVVVAPVPGVVPAIRPRRHGQAYE